MRYLVIISILILYACSSADAENDGTNTDFQYADQEEIIPSLEIGLDEFLTLTLDGESKEGVFKIKRLLLQSKEEKTVQIIEDLDYECENFEGTLQVSIQDYNWDGKDDFSILEINGHRQYWLYSDETSNFYHHKALSKKKDLIFTLNHEVKCIYFDVESSESVFEYFYLVKDSLIHFKTERDIEFMNGFSRKMILAKKDEEWVRKTVLFEGAYHENLDAYDSFYKQMVLQVMFGELVEEDEGTLQELRENFTSSGVSLTVPTKDEDLGPVVMGYAVYSSEFLKDYSIITDDIFPLVYEDNPSGILVYKLAEMYTISQNELVIKFVETVYIPYEGEPQLLDEESFYCYTYFNAKKDILYLPIQGRIFTPSHQADDI